MNGFDETVSPDDATGEDAAASAELTADERDAPKPMGGDDDLISGQYGPTGDYGSG